jgi:hypothetical protein
VYGVNGQIAVPESKQFRFYSSVTPQIYGVVPHGVAPGDSVTLYGDYQWWRLDMDRYDPGDPRGYIREARIGSFLCVPPHVPRTVSPKRTATLQTDDVGYMQVQPSMGR